MRYQIIIFLLILNPLIISKTTNFRASITLDRAPEALQSPENVPTLVDNSTTIAWIKLHRKEDGGYGRLDAFWSHGSWTYAALHALSLLNKTRTDQLAIPDDIYKTMLYVQALGSRNGYSSVPSYYSAFENILSLKLLGYESFNKRALAQELGQVNLTAKSNLEEVYYNIAALNLLNFAYGANFGNIEQLTNWLTMRQNADGGFDNIAPEDDPNLLDGTSYVTYTWYAAMTLSYLNHTISMNDALIKFVQSCQNPDGGFGNRPDGLGGSSDVYYTFAAIQTLKLLNSTPVDIDGAITWLNRLQNYDGGFGDKPTWNSRLYATYYAIHSLDMLNGTIFEKIRTAPKVDPIPEAYSVFSYGMEVSGYSEQFSSESVLMAHDLGLDIFGLKTQDTAQAVRANEFAQYYNLSTQTVLNPELPPERIDIKGIGRFTHVADVLYPPDGYPGSGGRFEWQTYKDRIIQGHGSGSLFYISSHTRDFDYLIIDDSIETSNGYDILGGGSTQGESLRQSPWLERWLGQIPMISNTDTHREFWKLRTQFNSMRNLFIAPNSTWEGFKEAIMKNHVAIAFRVSIEHEYDELVLYGAPECVNYLRSRPQKWMWWESHSAPDIQITPITHGSPVVPDNSYEWDLGNFTGPLLRIKNDTKITSFKLDGQLLTNLTFVNRTLAFSLSSFYYIQLENISKGTHVAEAEYMTQEGETHVKTVVFDIEYPSLYIYRVSHDPVNPTNLDSVTIKVTTVERVPVSYVKLWYSIGEEATWNQIIMVKEDGSEYSAVIDNLLPDTKIRYYVEAIGTKNKVLRYPSENRDYVEFFVAYQRSAEEYTRLLTFLTIPLIGVVGFFAEFHWNRKARKHS